MPRKPSRGLERSRRLRDSVTSNSRRGRQSRRTGNFKSRLLTDPSSPVQSQPGPQILLSRSRSKKTKVRNLPRRFTVRRRGFFKKFTKDEYWNPPANFIGTLPEWQVHLWLTRKKIRGWEFQSSIMGGRLQLGGVVADFLFGPPQWVPTMVWRVQGEYFHYATSEKQVQDLLQRITMEDRGFRVVDILAHDVSTNREEVLQAALGGQQLKPTQILI